MNRPKVHLVPSRRDDHMLGLEVPEDPRPGLAVVTLEDGLAHAVDGHVQVEVLDGLHVQLDGDEALRRRKNFLHVHRHLNIVAWRNVLYHIVSCSIAWYRVASYCICMVITYSRVVGQPGKVANPARGQRNRENEYFPVPVRA